VALASGRAEKMIMVANLWESSLGENARKGERVSISGREHSSYADWRCVFLGGVGDS
jgi:hypothetical protein